MKLLRKILFPFSALYYLITSLRNWGYDCSLFPSKSYTIPILGVGNLNTGGTGKTPMVAHIVNHFQTRYNVAILSRGYGRKSKGYVAYEQGMNAAQIGDEPLLLARNFSQVKVVVSENRQLGIEKLLEVSPQPQLIVLDDALQHRSVKAGCYVLLTSYNDVYSNDWVLPVGNLREPRRGARRAQVIVVTKCPEELGEKEKTHIVRQLNPQKEQQVFFSQIAYARHIRSNGKQMALEELVDKSFTLVTGIANPVPLIAFLKAQGLQFTHRKYGDHHNFALSEIKDMEEQEFILTTEKDFVRLDGRLNHNRLFYIPITITIDRAVDFYNILEGFCERS